MYRSLITQVFELENYHLLEESKTANASKWEGRGRQDAFESLGVCFLGSSAPSGKKHSQIVPLGGFEIFYFLTHLSWALN